MGEPNPAAYGAFMRRAVYLIRQEREGRGTGTLFRVDRATGSIRQVWHRSFDNCEYWAQPTKGLTIAWFRRKWEKGESRYDRIDVRPGAM